MGHPADKGDTRLATKAIVPDPDWRRANRTKWDERVGVHLGPRGYDLHDLRAGQGRLHAIEAAELPPVAGKRVLHLQCHFGADSLRLAQQGADVVGLDFSPAAMVAARALADELGLTDRARFVEADVYETPQAVPLPHGFDLVFVTWGAITWLPDITRWARIVATMLRPGGTLYLADAHPAAYVFDDATRATDGRPGFFAPYFLRDPIIDDDPRDYADPQARLVNTRTYNWIHPLGGLVTDLIASGMTLEWLHEHDAVVWRMFECLVKDAAGLYRWPDRPWLPLAFSLLATRR
jgi:SAM-dependent methyltransferase